jgi:hypothetical protein
MAGEKVTKYRLDLESKGFTGSIREARGEWQDFIKGMGDGAGKLGGIAKAAGPVGIALAAVAGAAVLAGKQLFDMAEGAVKLGGQLSDMSARTGLNVESLQRLGAAAKLSGGSMESISGAVGLLQKNLAKNPAAFQALGLSVTQLRKADPETLLLAVSNRLRELPEGFQRSAAGFAVLGKGAQEYMPVLTSNLSEAAADADRLGQVIRGDSVGALDALGDKIKVAEDSWEGFKNQLGTVIATNPAVIQGVRDIIEELGKLTTWVIKNKDEISSWVTSMVNGIKTVATTAKIFGAMIRGGFYGLYGAVSEENTGRTTGQASGRYGSSASRSRGGRPAPTLGGFDPDSVERLKKWNEEVKRGAEQLSRGGAQQEMAKLSAEIAMAGRMGGIAAPKLEEVRKKVLELKQAGAVATPVIERLGADVEKLVPRWTGTGYGNLGDLGHFAPTLTGTTADQVMAGLAKPGGATNVAISGVTSNTVNLEARNKAIRTSAAEARKAAEASFTWNAALQEVANTFTLLGINADSAFGRVFGGLTTGAAGFDKLKQLSKNSEGGGIKGALTGKQGLSGFFDAMSGGLQLAGAAMSVGKAIVGLFKSDPIKKAQKEAGAILGAGITRELADSINTTAKKLHISIGTASLLHLTDFMAETGKSATDVMPQITALFGGIISGVVPAKQGMAELNTLFDDLAKSAADGNVAAQKMTASLIQQGIAAGKLTDSMKQYVSAAMGQMAGGADKILAGVGMMGKTPLGAMGTAAAQSFAAGFTAQIGQKGLVQALEDSGAGIEVFYKKLMDEGNTAGAAMLAPWAQLSSKINDQANPALKGVLTTVQGMSEVFSGLDKVGFVTRDAFTGLETGIQGSVKALNDAGIQGPAALQAIAPQLAQIVQASDKYGFTIDANTQGLIDQAKAAGIAFPLDPMQQMIGLLGQIVVLMGGTLPASMAKTGEAAQAAFGTTSAVAAGAASDVAASVGMMAGGIQDAVAGIAPAMNSAVTEMQGATTNTLGEVVSNFGAAFSDASTTANTELEKVAKMIQGLADGFTIPVNVSTNLPESPSPVVGAAGGLGPIVAPNMGGGLGPLIQTHAGEGILVMPKSRMKRGAFFGAARGVGGDFEFSVREPRSGSGGTVSDPSSSGSYVGAVAASAAAAMAPVEAAIQEQRSVLAELVAQVQAVAERPTAPPLTVSVNAPIDTTGLPRASHEDFQRDIEQTIAAGVLKGRGPLFNALIDKGIAKR